MRVKRRSLRLQLVLTLYTCSWDSSKDALKALALMRTTMELMVSDMPSTTFSAKPYSLGGREVFRLITVQSHTRRRETDIQYIYRDRKRETDRHETDRQINR